MTTEADIARWFTYHPPTAAQRKAYERIREAAKAAALAIEKFGVNGTDVLDETIEELCPDGVERREALGSLTQIDDTAVLMGCSSACDEAILSIRAAVMWANAAIACAPTDALPLPEDARRCPCGAPIFPSEICPCGRDFDGSTT